MAARPEEPSGRANTCQEIAAEILVLMSVSGGRIGRFTPTFVDHNPIQWRSEDKTDVENAAFSHPSLERKKPRRNEAFWSAAYKQPNLVSGEAFVESYADRDCALSTSRMKPGHVGKKLDDPTQFSHLG